jgi:hypothetical protein
MFEITQATQTPASKETGCINSTWNMILFFFHKRVFLSRIESLLNAAAGHESNGLPSGNFEYQVLAARADELCTEFAERWGVDVGLLRARIPGLAKLARLSVPPPTKNDAWLAGIGMIAVPLALFLLGIMAGLVSVGFHLVGGVDMSRTAARNLRASGVPEEVIVHMAGWKTSSMSTGQGQKLDGGSSHQQASVSDLESQSTLAK